MSNVLLLMQRKLFRNKIYMQASTVHGYGVFAGKTIKKGELVEECAVIAPQDANAADNFFNYTFKYDDQYAILSGYGSMYNHAKNYNVEYTFKNKVAQFTATRTIYRGQELFVHYGNNWFASHGFEEIEPRPQYGLLVNPLTYSLLRMSIVTSALFGGLYALQYYYVAILRYLFRI